MEILFLLVGLPLMAVGILVVVSEARSRHGTQPVPGRVVGFSTGKDERSKESFHTVAEYVAGGHKYYIEGAVGSSVPLHTVGDPITVHANLSEPEKAVLESHLSYLLGGALFTMGLVSAAVFVFTFHPSLFSMGAAAFVIAGLFSKVRKAWRKQPLSREAWQEYKRRFRPTRVFTEKSRDQIAWAEAARITGAVERHRRTNRFAVPVLLVLGTMLLLLAYHFYQKTEAFLQIAQKASGRVVSLKERDSSDGDTTYSAVVEYRAAGETRRFVDSFSSSPPAHRKGDVVRVLYSPEDHNDAQIDRGMLNYWASVACGLSGSIFLVIGLHGVRKKSREQVVT